MQWLTSIFGRAFVKTASTSADAGVGMVARRREEIEDDDVPGFDDRAL